MQYILILIRANTWVYLFLLEFFLLLLVSWGSFPVILVDPINKIIVYGSYNKKYSKNKYLIKFSSVSYITIKKREIPAYPVTTLPSYSILLVDKFGDNKFILSGNYKDITMIANSISKILDVDIVL